MGYWIHLKRSLDQATIHRDRCLEIPSNPHRADYWVGGWEEYPDKDTALEALEKGQPPIRRHPSERHLPNQRIQFARQVGQFGENLVHGGFSQTGI